MGCISKFSSYVTMISYFFIVIINKFFTNPVFKCYLIENHFLLLHYDQIFVKVFFLYFFTVFVLPKYRFNKFISIIFISKNKNRLTKSIINTNIFVSKTTRNVILILFWVEPFINFSSQNYTQNQHNFKWNWYLFEIIFKRNCSFS